MHLIDKIFGTDSERELKKIQPIINKIEALGDSYASEDNKWFPQKTVELKSRLANGETLDDILPEAFATVREAAKRTLGMYPYRVQLIAGVVLHQGRVAEMRTGEGKTLMAVMPAYLNAGHPQTRRTGTLRRISSRWALAPGITLRERNLISAAPESRKRQKRQSSRNLRNIGNRKYSSRVKKLLNFWGFPLKP